jgi:hypothetical protein
MITYNIKLIDLIIAYGTCLGDTKHLSALAVFILSHGEDNGTIFAEDCMYRLYKLFTKK